MKEHLHSSYSDKKDKKHESYKKTKTPEPNTLKIYTQTSPTAKASTSVLSPKLVKPLDTAEQDTNSSSSDDQPIKGKDNSIAKRKVEVYSEESGRTGFTIKTSALSPKSKGIVDKKSLSTSEESSSSDASSRTLKVAPVIVKKTSPLKIEPREPTSILLLKVDTKTSTKDSMKESKELRTSKDLTLNVETPASNGKNNIADNVANTKKVLTSPRSAHPKLWLPTSQPSTDQVFITDVTVNLETVTIRECKTERGFFKARDLEQRNNLATQHV